MKKSLLGVITSILVFLFAILVVTSDVNAAGTVASTCTTSTNVLDYPACTSIQTSELGFQIPSLGDILTFAIRAFFVIAGLAALFYLLLGAMAWVTSGGDKDAITAAREKIQAAVLGMIMIVAVLAVIWTLEQVIFKRRICLGLSCPLTLPGLIETSSGATNCCVCPDGTGKISTSSNVVDTYGDLPNCL
ncbi:hypothetical protein KBD81_00175 [Candidatus Woesebacteria bacterium]|nr:hypothetical protein [Candidatus Woesebacteria bacterium]